MTQTSVRNPEYLRRCKVYAWDKVKQYTPRGIQPTDIEAAIELNSHYLYFEFKSEGAEMPYGQRLFFDRLLMLHRKRAVLMICEHESLSIVQPLKDGDLLSVVVRMYDEAFKGICQTPKIPLKNGEHMGSFIKAWCDHAQEIPNDFVTGFRKKCGIY